jgi:hypothetical protein
MQRSPGKLAPMPDELHLDVFCVEYMDVGDNVREDVLVGQRGNAARFGHAFLRILREEFGAADMRDNNTAPLPWRLFKAGERSELPHIADANGRVVARAEGNIWVWQDSIAPMIIAGVNAPETAADFATPGAAPIGEDSVRLRAESSWPRELLQSKEQLFAAITARHTPRCRYNANCQVCELLHDLNVRPTPETFSCDSFPEEKK